MIDLNINGSEVLIKGMENLPLAFRDVYNGKYMGKPIVEFEHDWKWFPLRTVSSFIFDSLYSL